MPPVTHSAHGGAGARARPYAGDRPGARVGMERVKKSADNAISARTAMAAPRFVAVFCRPSTVAETPDPVHHPHRDARPDAPDRSGCGAGVAARLGR